MTSSNTYSEREIFHRWFPLVVGRFCMILEIPIAAYALANFANPESNLAAFGALFIPITYFCEAAVWNLLGSSASLVRTKEDLRILRRFLFILYCVILIAALVLVETPLADLFVIPFFGTTRSLFEFALPSILIGVSFPLLVGYRRINHGVLVYAGKSKSVSSTSFLRIFVLILSLLSFNFYESALSGITVVAISMLLSYLTETIYSEFLVHRFGLSFLTDSASQLSIKSAWKFCSPMIFASLVAQIMLPVGAAILFRLPESQLSLVVWPAVSGFLQLTRTPGSAFIELTASLGDNPENYSKIEKFSYKISVLLFVFLLLFSFTGLANFYFNSVGGLEKKYADFAARTLIFAVLFPPAEIRLWFLTGAAYALKMTKLTAHATVIATALGLALYLVALNQSYISGATFVVLMWTVCTIAENLYFSFRIKQVRRN